MLSTDLPPMQPGSEVTGSAFPLAGQIDFRAEKFNSKILVREEGFNIILFALLKDQIIPEHKTPNNAYLQCLEGKVTVTLGGVAHPLQNGELILLPKEIMHGIVAVQDTKLLLMKPSK